MKKSYFLLILIFIPIISFAALNLPYETTTFYEENRTSKNEQSEITDPSVQITNDQIDSTINLGDPVDFNLNNRALMNDVRESNIRDSFGVKDFKQAESLPNILRKCGDKPSDCGFEELIQVVNALLQWAMMGLASVATIMFVYAGFLYMSAQGDSNQVKKAHGIFRVVLIGFVIILLAYLLVQEFLKYFLDPNSSNIYKLLNNK